MRALDRINEQRPRPTNKTDQAAIIRQARARRPHRLALKQQMRPGLFNRTELRERFPVELPSELWSSICVLQSHAQRFEREKEIAEKNRCVEIKVLHGPKRNLSGQLGSLAQLHERVLLPQPLVMLVISSGLAHQPDRRGGMGAARPTPFE